jgi:hypothetical protein
MKRHVRRRLSRLVESRRSTPQRFTRQLRVEPLEDRRMLSLVDIPGTDFGNAPASYRTLLAADGARHVLSSGLSLGAAVDAEPDGQPSAAADGDDRNLVYPGLSDDEDGVVFTSLLVPGNAGAVTVTASASGKLNAWVDFNADGDWNDASEQIFTNTSVSAGPNNLSFSVPQNAAAGETYARFRLNAQGGLNSFGLATDGEVEDYRVETVAPGSITVVTDAIPDDPQDFTFTSTFEPPVFALDDDADPTLPNSRLFDPLGAQTYTVTEGAVPGWKLSGIVIIAGDLDNGSTVDVPNRTVDIDLDPGEQITVKFVNELQLDLGDAPGNYRTLLAADGARHIRSTELRLGQRADAEPDGQPTAGADGDDLNLVYPGVTDDEDGVLFTSALVAGNTATVTVTASAAGRLNAWLDFNADGDWNDAGEQIFTNTSVVAGPNNLSFPVPQNAAAGATYARFRLNAQGGLNSFGLATDGEVEDYRVETVPPGRITVTTDTQPNDPQDFGYTGDLGAFILDDDSDPTLPASRVFDYLVPGTYVVRENALPSWWDLSNIMINDPDNGSSVDLVNRKATLDVDPGEAITVSFTHTGSGSITVVKDAIPDSSQDVTITSSFAPYSFLLDDDADPTLPSSRLFSPLPAQVHWVTEGALTGWDLGNITFVGDLDHGSTVDLPNRRAYVDLDPGEQITVTFTNVTPDFGDAPDNPQNPNDYPTLLASNGARHRIIPGIHLGATIDQDSDGQPTALADGDDLDAEGDDEDGVQFMSLVVPGEAATVRVTASVAGKLNAWLDFNHDGDWADAGERIFLDRPLVAGVNSLYFVTPVSATLAPPEDPTFARFRYNTTGNLSFTGLALDGEVEDYAVAIILPRQRNFDFNTFTSPTQQTPLPYIPVFENDVYDPAVRRYGWAQSLVPEGQALKGSYDRGSLGGDPEENLLQDGHWSNSENIFRVDLPNGDYIVNVKMGDAVYRRDFIELYAEDSPTPTVSVPEILPGQFLHLSSTVTVNDGRLDLRIRDAGGDPSWVINALEITPAPRGAILLIPPPGQPLLADPTVIDPVLGIASPGALVTVNVTLATNVTPDASSVYEGVQVQADNVNGQFIVLVRRPSGPVTATISAEETTAARKGSTTIAYYSPAGMAFDLNVTGSPNQTGHTPVLPATAYTPALGYGWVGGAGGGAPLGFARGALPGTTCSDLLRDGAYGSTTTPRTFGVDLVPGTYEVTVVMGDTFARDQMNVAVVAGSGPGLSNVSSAAGQYTTNHFTAQTDLSGHLELRFSDGGGDLYWVVNALAFRPVAAPLTVSPNPVTLEADGLTVTPFTVTGATVGSVYTVSTTAGTITTADGDARFTGIQVVATAASFTFAVRSPTGFGISTIAVEEALGLEGGTAAVSYTVAAVRRFDFNGSTNYTPTGFLPVRGNVAPYAASRGYGWNAPVLEFERGTPSSLLRRDGHYGSGSAGATFTIQADPAKTYSVRVYVGDTAGVRGQIQVTVEGSAYTITSLPAGTFNTTVTPGVTSGIDGLVTVNIKDLGGANPYWVINGIDIWDTWAATPVPALRAGQIGAAAAVAVTPDQLASVVEQAVGIWEGTGLNSAQVAILRSTPVAMTNLDAQGYLGLTTPDRILIDDDGVGFGWSTGREVAAGKYDLLTTVLHEMGHVLGQGHGADGDLMDAILQPGEQHLPELDSVFAAW